MYAILREFAHNATFWAALTAWIVAQFTKLLCSLAVTGRPGTNWLVSTGGMPSAHSAMVCSLATSVGWHCGCASPAFGFAVAFAILTMFDASTVRRAAGMQAKLLNEMVDELFKEHRLSERKVRELLGHTRIEVFFGLVMGIVTGFAVNPLFDLFL